MTNPKTIPRKETSRPIKSSEWPSTPIKETVERSGNFRLDSPPLCGAPSPCGCWANADVALTATRPKPAATVVTTRRKRVIEEKVCLLRQSNMMRLMLDVISSICWRFLIQFGILSYRQAQDYRQSEL